MINLNKKTIFCHNEKTAGTSMSMELRQLRGNYYIASNLRESRDGKIDFNEFTWETGIHYPNMHMRMRTYNKIVNLSDFYSFAFVRNPKTRYVSLYTQQLKYFLNDETMGAEKALQVQNDVTIDIGPEWDTITPGIYKFNFEFFLTTYNLEGGNTQTAQLCDSDNNIMCDFIGRYETLEEDWGAVCSKVGIPYRPLLQTNKSGLDQDTVEQFYTSDLKGFLFDKYSDEFEVFDYEKG